jgi:tellurite resistance protein
MGLFDKVLGIKEAEKLNKEESFAAITLSAIAADGYITDEEAIGIITGLTKMKLFQNYDTNKMRAMFKKLLNIIRRQNIDALIKMSNENLSPEFRETAFAVATDLALADGTIDQSEKDILTKIQETLEISEDVAIKIIDVMLIKNKG